MTFFESIKTVFTKYAEFGGRASRPEYWWFALFSFLVSSALNYVTVIARGGEMYSFATTSSSFSASMSFAGLWSIAVLLPSLAVAVRRLRDAGRDWTQLFWILLPIAGIIILIVRLCEPGVVTTSETSTPA